MGGPPLTPHERRSSARLRRLHRQLAAEAAAQPAAAQSAAAGETGSAPSADEITHLRSRSSAAWAAHRARAPPSAPFASWVNGTPYDDADCARASVDSDRRVDFDTDGFLHLRGFAPPAECTSMLERMHELVEGWDPVGELVGFNTRAKEQESAQGSSDYFLDSADRIHFFAELDAIDDATGSLVQGLSKQRALNKVGHGLHLHDDVFRGYAQAPRMRNLLRDLGWQAPVLPQSMYIFKQPLIGGESTSHQDSGFLYTTPRQTCIGIWLALHPATLSNGCLWVRPGSHTEPVRRQMYRNPDYFENDGEASAAEAGAASAQGAPRPQVSSASDDLPPSPPEFRGSTQMIPPAQMVFRDYSELPGSPASGVDSPAKAWDGQLPAGSEMPRCDGLFDAGFLPVECEAGDLLVFAGELDHLSLPNFSEAPRHTFQLHAIEGPSAGIAWSPDNWLQYPGGAAFPPLGAAE